MGGVVGPQIGGVARHVGGTLAGAVGATGFDQLVILGVDKGVITLKAPVGRQAHHRAQLQPLRALLAALHGQQCVVRVARDDVFLLDAIGGGRPFALALGELLLQAQLNLACRGQLEGAVAQVQGQHIGDGVMALG